MRVAHSGRAKISIRRPMGMAECDVCSLWWNLVDLSRQRQWAGNSLIDTGYLVCRECLDVPQDQYRSPILPPDPRPLINPRPSPNVTPIVYIGGPLATTPDNQGFTQYTLGASFAASGLPPALTQAGVLASLAAISGVPTPDPTTLASYVVPMQGNRTVSLVFANPSRSFLAVYNPTQLQAQISTGSATQGAITNLAIGPGEAYFWSTAQGLGPAYTGGMTAIGFWSNLPLWAWEDSANLTNLYDDGGLLALTAPPAAYPTSPTGLPVGAVWNNGLSISVIGPTTPNPAAPPILFGSITAAALLAIGGADLPLSDPFRINQLWNNGGLICVSLAPTGPNPFVLDSSLLDGSDVLGP